LVLIDTLEQTCRSMRTGQGMEGGLAFAGEEDIVEEATGEED
jgi:hypothetical protein